MSLTITWHSDSGHEYAVLTDDDERVCLPYPLNDLPEPIKLERRSGGFWKFVQTMTNVQFKAWGEAKSPSTGSTRIPKMQ